jgi:hypothetical protein
MNGKKVKIKSSKSEAIYDVLVKLLKCSSNFYEKESFIYHHSVVSHEIRNYNLKTHDSLKVNWKFSIYEDEILQFNCKEGASMDVFLKSIAIQNKANSLIAYILKE